jgi:hypothetical protein
MPAEKNLVAAHYNTLNNLRSKCFFMTERNHRNMADFLEGILPPCISV